MRSVGWRVMASAVACFGLSLAAGCDDDGGKTDDMAMNTTDMAVELDMSTPGPDMALAKGTARLLLADVVGNVYAAAGGDNTPVAVDAHILSTLTTFPRVSSPSDFVDPMLSQTPGTIHGCIADRYSLANIADAGMKLPGMDEDVGTVSITGFTPAVMTNGVTTAPVPNAILCQRAAGLGVYGCVFATTNDGGANPWNGMSPSAGFFPPVLPGPITNDPLLAGAGTTITFAAPGGGDYTSPINLQVTPIPDTLNIASIKKNGTALGSTNLDAIGTLASTDELEIAWACDNTTTAGSGCPSVSSNPFDLIVAVVITSGGTRSNFKSPGLQNPSWGQISCFEETGKGATSPNGTAILKIPAGAIAAMKGSAGLPNGSYQIAIVRVQASPGGSNGHTVFTAAGNGRFGLNNF